MTKTIKLRYIKIKSILNRKLNIKLSSKKGLTLIEVIISVVISSILLVLLSNIFNNNASYWIKFNKELEIKRNVNIAKVFIEKRVREYNQADIIYDDKNKIIKGINGNGNIVLVNLSGKRAYDDDTLIYFYRDEKEVRVNKNGEHNVLARYIDDIIIREVISERLLEIIIFADLIDYSIKINLRIN